ncbi:MAG: glutaredoxin family protein [Christensenellaceae bacterium]|jgi:glutaredoxin-like protein NrdH
MIDFKKVDGKDVGDIKIFALSTCTWCKKTKSFLADHDIAYSYIDVDLVPDGEVDEVRKEQFRYNPQGSFPTIIVNGGSDVIIGFDEPKLEKLVN